jgi:hypothetical protein
MLGLGKGIGAATSDEEGATFPYRLPASDKRAILLEELRH